ncbi:clusterin-like protein 1 [Oreochromis aureus]|uniref:Clusterin n=1 Tax=Oreochromis aureus TaxID=47969 RepID=A0A668VU54_OREAU|nr:clusterin-like protein 1 [Oreochromis aureus]XP_039473781.1 clusterin-like protein 1 [Oreochromis aureus]XP_039473782.1 clusterin-like protein 1 [Oreochromis aureus]XP_039473783.1 clusterin-like protein 1 [Oreochromis aureus]XP_039473784.1 clusterin-like protein 1 [Oreochromis aureus]XP_039473785.1 clusterin-like protein 1 [Oreochromis aureus]
MWRFLAQILFIAEVMLCAADSPPISEETLKRLSAAGEQYVDEELKGTLLGVKQVKEMMEKKEEKHRHLMDALRHSSDKKKGVMQLAKETQQKLEEAEQQCQDLTKSSFGECRPCLEDSCKAFYTSTCRRGFASFSFKVDEFFRKMATKLEDAEQVHNKNEENSGGSVAAENQVTEDKSNMELLQAEASFSELLSNISLLYNQSIGLAKKMQPVFGHAFLETFATELQSSTLSTRGSSSGFLGSVGLEHVLHSVLDFGKSMVGGFSAPVADLFEEIKEAEEYVQQSSRDTGSFSAMGPLQSGYMCRRLRRQASECWKLQDLCETCRDYLLNACPSVQQLHSEMEEMYMLLNASLQQYDGRLQLVHRHTADTQMWLSSMHDKYGWVSQLSNSTVDPHSIFSVILVSPQQQIKNNKPKADSSVTVSVMDSAPVTILVPADLEVDDPAFIQNVAQEALTLYKRQIKGME